LNGSNLLGETLPSIVAIPTMIDCGTASAMLHYFSSFVSERLWIKTRDGVVDDHGDDDDISTITIILCDFATPVILDSDSGTLHIPRECKTITDIPVPDNPGLLRDVYCQKYVRLNLPPTRPIVSRLQVNCSAIYSTSHSLKNNNM
jgi:hypothetical protein